MRYITLNGNYKQRNRTKQSQKRSKISEMNAYTPKIVLATCFSSAVSVFFFFCCIYSPLHEPTSSRALEMNVGPAVREREKKKTTCKEVFCWKAIKVLC